MASEFYREKIILIKMWLFLVSEQYSSKKKWDKRVNLIKLKNLLDRLGEFYLLSNLEISFLRSA